MRLDLMETFLCIFLMEHFPLHLEPIIEISLHYIFFLHSCVFKNPAFQRDPH
jgi:hypothetical protein